MHQRPVRIPVRAEPQGRRPARAEATRRTRTGRRRRRGVVLTSAGSVTGIVLAGGRSTRFGDADKLTAEVAGVPLLHHPVLRVAEATGDVIIVVAPGADPPPMPPGVPMRVARDAAEDEGPLAGVLAGLLMADTDLAIVVGGDMPTLVTAVLLELLRVAREAPVDAVALQEGEGFRPLPIVLRVAPAIDAAHTLLHDGERRLRSLLEALRTAVVDEPTWRALDPTGATLADVDLPEDLPAVRS